MKPRRRKRAQKHPTVSAPNVYRSLAGLGLGLNSLRGEVDSLLARIELPSHRETLLRALTDVPEAVDAGDVVGSCVATIHLLSRRALQLATQVDALLRLCAKHGLTVEAVAARESVAACLRVDAEIDPK